MTGPNNVVIAHELLHTVGATDKYDPVTDAPRIPDGLEIRTSSRSTPRNTPS